MVSKTMILYWLRKWNGIGKEGQQISDETRTETGDKQKEKREKKEWEEKKDDEYDEQHNDTLLSTQHAYPYHASILRVPFLPSLDQSPRPRSPLCPLAQQITPRMTINIGNQF